VTVPGDPIFARTGWWDDRAFASLRSVTAFRLELLSAWLGGLPGRGADGSRATVVDLGCGGGLMAVPILRAGANVVGIDLALPALREAHAAAGNGGCFVAADLHACPIASGSADLVLLADVLEHVDDQAGVIAEAARLLRPSGRLFVHTINRTRRARWLAVDTAERLGLIPTGTHDPARFVRPDELAEAGRRAGLRIVCTAGEGIRWWATLRRRAIVLRPSRSLALGYAILFAKDA
jgi:2-polyprenyl-6-hydroxyphenyl methylase/3-demethylubiquinone-9 3-methyltransferase